MILSFHYSLKLCHFLPCRLGEVAEGENKAHIIVFRLANFAEGQKLHLMDAGVSFYYLAKGHSIFFRIVYRGDNDLSYGRGDALIVEIIEKFKGRRNRTADVFAVLAVGGVFHVKKHHVGMGEKLPYFIVKDDTGGIEAGVDLLFVAKPEYLSAELSLHERLAAGEGDAAFLAEIFAVSFRSFHYILGSILSSRHRVPGIGIMAAPASEGTARKERYEAYPRAVYCTETLYGMDLSYHTDSWNVLEITSFCCSRESLLKLTA